MVGGLDRRLVGARVEPEYLIGFLDAHIAAAAVRRWGLAAGRVVAPVWMDTVEIGFDKARALLIGGAALAQQIEKVGGRHLFKPQPGEASGEHGAGHRAGVVVE